MYHIDQWKNKGLLPKDIKLEKSGAIIKSILKVYNIYQNKTKDLNAFDFGDLILFCVKLFEENQDIREIYQKNFKYILVDEFQDTAVSQFDLLKALTAEWQQDNASHAGHPRTLFVVGDGMQSIYGFRAAKVGLFLTAKSSGIVDLPLHSVELVQNFRSTPDVVEWNNHHFSQAFPSTIDISRGAVPYAKAKSIGCPFTRV